MMCIANLKGFITISILWLRLVLMGQVSSLHLQKNTALSPIIHGIFGSFTAFRLNCFLTEIKLAEVHMEMD